MADRFLSAEQRAELLRLMRRQMNSAIHRRINVVLLLDDGWLAERVAEALFIDAETVRQHRLRFARTGIKGLTTLNYQLPQSALTQAQLQELDGELATKLYMTAKEVCHFVKQRCDVDYTPNAMAKLLKRRGYVYKKPHCVPAKADAGVQQRFHDETLRPLMQQAGTGRKLYFVDGMHPAYSGHPAFGWIKRGCRQELASNHGRVNVTIDGALSWPERDVVRLEAEKITSAAMISLFERLEALNPSASAIDVVLDNASYNRSAAIKEWLARDGCRVRLVYLPAYSPNLNLIERLWLLLKKTALWNRHYPKFADFKAAISGFFANIQAYHDQLTSPITDNFRFIGEPNYQLSRA
jgi:transposase